MRTTIMLTLVLLPTSAVANSINKLMIATQNGETKLVAQITKHIPINSRDPNARTAVHHAVTHNQPEVLNFLIENGADLNLIDADGNTPYDLYVQDQHNKIGLLLRNATALTAEGVAKRLDTEESDSEAGKALAKRHADMLFAAAEAGDREAIELLLAAGANPKAKNAAGEFPFHVAERNRRISCCAILLKAIVGNGVSRGDNRSWTPMHWAILDKDWEMVRELIHEGATLRYRAPPSSTWHRQDPYDIAELTHQEDIFVAMAITEQEHNQKLVQELLEKATREGRLDIYQRLLDNGLSLQDKETADVAVGLVFSGGKNDYTERIVEFLIANKVNKSSLAEKMASYGALSSPVNSLEKILEYGVDPNMPDTNGNLPLASAVSRSSVKPSTVAMLLKHSADPNKRQKDGATALISLVKYLTAHYNRHTELSRDKYLEITHLLLTHGADPNIVQQNNTALDILQKELQARVTAYEYNKNNITSSNIATIRSMIEMLIAKGAKDTKEVKEVGEGA